MTIFGMKLYSKFFLKIWHSFLKIYLCNGIEITYIPNSTVRYYLYGTYLYSKYGHFYYKYGTVRYFLYGSNLYFKYGLINMLL